MGKVGDTLTKAGAGGPEGHRSNQWFAFILIFALIFAILQKTKLLGDESKRVNAMISLVIGLMLIAFPPARNLVVLLMPFLAVVAVILLVFMLLYGFIVGKKEGDVLSSRADISSCPG